MLRSCETIVQWRLRWLLNVDEIDASPGLRDRVMARIASEDLSTARPVQIAWPRARRRTSLWGLAMAAMLLVSLGFGYWNVHLKGEVRKSHSSGCQLDHRS